MSKHAHDWQCDTGNRCPMCVECDPIAEAELHATKGCCDRCDESDRLERQLTTPTFNDAWSQASATTIRLVERTDAEWFWLKGQQAGRIAEQVETRRMLQQMMEGYIERTR